MKFEHLIEINDPRNPMIAPMTRAQLWRGLVLRAEAPTLFVAYLDACEILSRSSEGMRRALRFGNLLVRDRVHFVHEHQVQYEVPEQNEIVAATLTMTIEEPEPGYLFVRFTYEDNSPEGGSDDVYNDYRRAAWRESDIDTIRTMRQLAAEGRFGTPSAHQ